jgi:hemoglobin-like flavoprotein
MELLAHSFDHRETEDIMTPDQIKLVQQSWARVTPIADVAATLFYQRLFELDPSLRSMFKRDMKEQQRMLMQVLAVAVSSLNNLEKLLPTVQALGRRHSGYGVTAQHYVTVGEALLWTLEQGLGEEFNAEVRKAWTLTYLALAGTMQAAAAQKTEEDVAA